MRIGAALRGLMRIIGIVLIFSILGPLAFAVLVLLIVAGFGAPLLQVFAVFAGLDTFSTIVSVALWVLTIAAMLASFPPSAVAGLIFALVAVCADLNKLWTAWLATAVAIAGLIVAGHFIVVDESSAIILPSVRGAGESLSMFGMLGIHALPPVVLCWWLSKPLHRASIAT